MKVEKYLTAEQQKLIEEERVADEERRAREKGDNWRGRGLDKMMGGVLEVKREDELKKVQSLKYIIKEIKSIDKLKMWI